jgi:hypothetical protein
MSGYNIKAIDAELECLNARIAERDATIASQAAQIERLREATERSLHILQYCPDKQGKAVALLSAALQPKEDSV